MTNEEFEKYMKRLRSPERMARLSPACTALWPQPMSWDSSKMEFTAAFDTTADMANPMGWLHGGVMATIFDNGMGTLASVVSGGHPVPTVSMSLNYLRPVPLVGRVIVKAEILKPGRNFIHTTARLYTADDQNTPLASATAVYAILKDVTL